VREAAEAALGTMGEAVETALREAVKSEDPEQRDRAWRLLKAVNGRNRVELVRGLRAIEVLEYADTPAGRMYGLATYFLVNDGGDALANDAQTRPDLFWSGYDVRLGPPLGPRYLSDGVWRRDFAGGTVLVLEPGSDPKTVALGSGYRDLDGVARTSVSLTAASGAVLVRDIPDPVPPEPTQTTVDTTPTPTATPAPPAGAAARTSHVRASASAKRGRVRVHGKVRGATAGKVKITVQQRRGRQWKTTRRAVARVSRTGAYSRRLSRLPRGAYRVRAAYLGTLSAGPSHSAYRRFSVRAPA